MPRIRTLLFSLFASLSLISLHPAHAQISAGGVVRYAIEMEWLEYFAGFSQAPGL